MMTYEPELVHHGVKGMKWGVRRYQAYGEGGYNPKYRKKAARKVYRSLQKGNMSFLTGVKRRKNLEDTAKEIDKNTLRDALSPESKESLKKAHSEVSHWTKENKKAMDAFYKKYGDRPTPEQYRSKEGKRWEYYSTKMIKSKIMYSHAVEQSVKKDFNLNKSLANLIVSKDNKGDFVLYGPVLRQAVKDLDGIYDNQYKKK